MTPCITTIIKKKEKERRETNEYRTYKIRKGPVCYVLYIICLQVVLHTYLEGEPKKKNPRTESIGDVNTGSLLISVPRGSSVEGLSRPCQPACSSYSLRHHVGNADRRRSMRRAISDRTLLGSWLFVRVYFLLYYDKA